MRITAIRATPVLVPLEAPYLWSYGALGGFAKTIVEVETDTGPTGIAEGPSHETAPIVEAMAERLTGGDPLDMAGLERRVLPSMPGAHTVTDHGTRGAWGAIEIALWDIRGKLWGQPVANLLGGIHRREIGFTDYFAFREDGPGVRGERSVEEVVAYCLGLRERHGTTMFEGKLSDPDIGANVRLIEALRDALGPEAMIRVDSNQAFSLPSALALAPALAAAGVRNWEDPTPEWRDMVRLRRHCAVPFSGHHADVELAAALGVPDAIVADVATLGGFSAAMRFVSACAGAGIDFWCYSGGSGLSTAAYLHLCAAHPHVREPNQSLLRQQPEDVIEGGPFAPAENQVPLTEGPGLGVTLDRARVDRLAARLREEGPPDKYRDPAAPGRLRRMPLV